MKNLKGFLLTLGMVLSLSAFAQNKAIEWDTKIERYSENTYLLTLDATIAKGYHLYSQKDAVAPTDFEFECSGCTLNEGTKEAFEPKKDMQGRIFFSQKARFTQEITVTADKPECNITISAFACKGKECKTEYSDIVVDFNKAVQAASPDASKVSAKESSSAIISGQENKTDADDSSVHAAAGAEDGKGSAGDEDGKDAVGGKDAKDAEDTAAVATDTTAADGKNTESEPIWGLILEAILWGFATLITPCVFPMVPMTVSFFMKGSTNRAEGRFKASMYGLFIVLLYTIPISVIILITTLIGGDAVTASIFNWLSTHWLPNILFFIIFMVFAASFFGVFEISLPQSFVNKADKGADKKGLLGVFFMALTLVLVSFSCTGPIVGTVLIKSTQGEFWTPMVTMLAFSTAFALPFTILAFSPTLLNRFKKTGGSWLNSVKIVLGFVELALGLKFLNMADMAYDWRLLDREIYLAIWIVIFTLLGFYILGKLRFKGEEPLESISFPRLTLAIAIFSFVVYMIPGLWGAPLKALSGYIPPIQTQDFVLGANTSTDDSKTKKLVQKYDLGGLPHGLQGYYTLDEAVAAAKKENKPVFIDFTGKSCANCREMESNVWSDPRVQDLLKNDYIIAALYMDDKTVKLKEEDWITDPNGKVYKTMGRAVSYIAETRFGVVAQPTYVLMAPSGEILMPKRVFDRDIDAYIQFLEEGLEKFKEIATE